jgi:flagellar motor switch protein FliN/FliY
MADELSQEDIDALLGGGDSDGDLSGSDLDALLGAADSMGMPDFSGQSSNVIGAGDAGEPTNDIDILYDVELNVRVELGRTKMKIEDILRLKEGAVVTFDKEAGAQVDILVNNQLVAHGEVLVLNDLFCVRVTEILSSRDRALLPDNYS